MSYVKKAGKWLVKSVPFVIVFYIALRVAKAKQPDLLTKIGL